MNAGDGVQIGVAVVLTLTLGAVVWYAWEARRLADEARDQRLDADRPYLLIAVQGLEQIEWEELQDVAGAEPERATAYPKAITCHISNAGRGPAKEVVATVLQPLVQFEQKRKDVVAPSESWRIHVSAARLAGVIHEGFTGQPPMGLKDWMKGRGIKPSYDGGGYDCGIIVCCTDIHDRPWATYLSFGLITHTDLVRKVVTERILVPVEQRIVQLGKER